jgi:hypothetical protein
MVGSGAGHLSYSSQRSPERKRINTKPPQFGAWISPCLGEGKTDGFYSGKLLLGCPSFRVLCERVGGFGRSHCRERLRARNTHPSQNRGRMGTPRFVLYSLKIKKRIPPLRRMIRFANHPTSVGMTVSLGSLIGTLRRCSGQALKPCPDTSLLDSGRK